MNIGHISDKNKHSKSLQTRPVRSVSPSCFKPQHGLTFWYTLMHSACAAILVVQISLGSAAMKKQRIGYDLPGAECCPAVLRNQTVDDC